MTTALIVKADGTVQELESLSLTALQTAVGGWVQAIDLSPEVSLWCNEEGKLVGLPHNPHAQILWDEAFGAGTDFIVGDVVFTGTPDSEGETQGLSETTAQRIREMVVAS